jgi:hypothetical protein
MVLIQYVCFSISSQNSVTHLSYFLVGVKYMYRPLDLRHPEILRIGTISRSISGGLGRSGIIAKAGPILHPSDELLGLHSRPIKESFAGLKAFIKPDI